MITRYAIAALAGLVLLGSVYLYGRHDERAIARGEAVAATERQFKERGNTNAQINRLDIPALCAELDGVWRDGRCE